ncbi:hypothetical protein BST22_02805 [Mycolicibacterium chubuense]|uniref:DUF3592 domain-containing protein n=1 Tax=Mycolicibacterium chubuense TaxID=1800 RepID=A0A0J6VBC6_MYCCU|nr:hypothetical protein [Mycolicibacterium chubuense]KMO67012.1 hypothetical protein MCHUDSM44219_05671 [Mycolicibacterium chubuense]ORA55489.1 hypothetical protein BST22_02805 [Mycolicibacterium chubuense]SPX95865.1 Uncharacterised protein [Mycolicibacterium chubuense]
MPTVLPLLFFCFLIAGTAAVLLVPSSAMVKSRGVVVGLRCTGEVSDGCREVELDVIVSRTDGGQFAVRETALIPESALADFTPGTIIDTFYRPGDETSIAVRMPRR